MGFHFMSIFSRCSLRAFQVREAVLREVPVPHKWMGPGKVPADRPVRRVSGRVRMENTEGCCFSPDFSIDFT